ncbi:MAG TPA: hypothetical protein VH256_06675 [Thermoleophilaceae bacterium]|nr:hypothetical protein [Thermoleophilaceae bacterium]
MADKLVTRSSLQRSLVANALSKPLNVLVPAVVVVAGIVLGALWLIPVALVIYAVLAALTFFDSSEAERVGKRVYGTAAKQVPPPKQADLSRLAPPIAQQLGSARAEEARIRTAVSDADLPFQDVTNETDALVQAMESIAIRAERVYDYLASHDPRPVQARLSQLQAAGTENELAKALQEQLAAYDKLSTQLQKFYDEMEHITSSLATVGAQVVSMSAASDGESGQRELAGQVRDLREQVNALSDGMSEAYAAQPDTP